MNERHGYERWTHSQRNRHNRSNNLGYFARDNLYWLGSLVITELAIIGAPSEHLRCRPACRALFGCCDAFDKFLLQRSVDLPRGSLDRFFEPTGGGRGFDDISELVETRQAPAENFSGTGERQSMILTKGHRNDRMGQLRKWDKTVLRVLPGTQTVNHLTKLVRSTHA